MSILNDLEPGDSILLSDFEPGCIIPDGWHTVSAVNPDGSFHVGGNTAVWPHRIKETAKTPNGVNPE